jgi:prepilin-type N-terminal cleavage/methylation domain-containing protein
MMCPPAAKRSSAAFSLVEMMIAAAVLALATGGIYAAFLQANKVAANARSLTAARFILQRAADQALTATWDLNAQAPEPGGGGGNLPEFFNPDYPAGGDVQNQPEPCSVTNNYDPGVEYPPNNEVVLLADPHGDTIITGHLKRQISFSDSTTNPSTLIRITFTLEYEVNGIPKTPQQLTVIRAQG